VPCGSKQSSAGSECWSGSVDATQNAGHEMWAIRLCTPYGEFLGFETLAVIKVAQLLTADANYAVWSRTAPSAPENGLHTTRSVAAWCGLVFSQRLYRLLGSLERWRHLRCIRFCIAQVFLVVHRVGHQIRHHPPLHDYLLSFDFRNHPAAFFFLI